MITIPALYLVFVAHYAVNVPFEDDWIRVPLIHAAMHGNLTFGSLWALDNFSRMLVPNSIFVGLGVLTHDDLRTVVALSAVTFVGTFYLLLLIIRSYLGRSLTPLLVLATGVVWFSLENWHNILWAFQLAWYLILLCLVAIIWLLQVARQRTLTFALAIAAAIVGSFSFIHGLALWPVGLICLVWTRSTDPRQTRRKVIAVAVWLVAAIGTTISTIWGYTFKTLGCSGIGGTVQLHNCTGSVSNFALHHPARVIAFLLVSIGEVVPNAVSATLWLNGLLGAVLLAAAVAIVVQSVRQRDDGRNCLPTALITFGLLFALMVAIFRAEFLTIVWVNSSYSMPSLLILLGIVIYAWDRMSQIPAQTRRVLALIGIALLLVQFGVTTRSGIAGARTYDRGQFTAARLVVNLDTVPRNERGCYDIYGVLAYLLFDPAALHYAGYAEAQEDHLSVFSTGLLQKYRAEGLPKLTQCTTR